MIAASLGRLCLVSTTALSVGCGLVGEPRYLRFAPEASTSTGMDAAIDTGVVSVDATLGDGSTADDVPVTMTPDVLIVADAPTDVPDPCPAGQVRCGTDCVDTRENPSHCGDCGSSCASGAHSVASCSMGRCGLACDLGFGDCDNNAANGCESPLNTMTNCGRCGIGCSAGVSFCGVVAGVPACVAQCPAGQTLCSGGCVNLRVDPANCGGCGNACGAGPQQIASCVDSLCMASCRLGFGNCDRIEANGCETRLDTPLHCGSCATVCPQGRANQVAVCNAGACTLECLPGFADCDRNAANGCETRTSADTSNCGACGAICNGGLRAACARGMCTSCPFGTSFCASAGGVGGLPACCPLTGLATCNTILAGLCNRL